MTFTTNLQHLYKAIIARELRGRKHQESGDAKNHDPASPAEPEEQDPSGPEPQQAQAEDTPREASPAPAAEVPPSPVPAQTQSSPVLKPKRKKARGLFS